MLLTMFVFLYRFKYRNTTMKYNKRSSTVSHMTTSLDMSINEMVSETGCEYSDSGDTTTNENTNINCSSRGNNSEHIEVHI